MLITAVHSLDLKPTELWDMSDREVIKHLAGCTDRRASVLGSRIWARRLYKPIYRTSYHSRDGSQSSFKMWDDEKGVYKRFRIANLRMELIEKIEHVIGLVLFDDPERGIGAVTIHCPDQKMSVKEFKMLVLTRPDGEVVELRQSQHPPTRTEIDAILDTHLHLWRLEVFVDPDIVELDPAQEFSRKLAGAIQREVGPRNEISLFEDVADVDLDAWIENETLKHDLKKLNVLDRVGVSQFEGLVAQYRDGHVDVGETERLSRLSTLLKQLGVECSPDLAGG